MTVPARRLHFVVPAYDEWENMPFLLRNLAGLARFSGEQVTVHVVDDGSTDGTAEIAEDVGRRIAEIDVRVVRHAVNQGPGAAFRTGIGVALASAEDHDFIITIEADNTSDVLLVPRMLDRAERGADLVLATVYGAGRIVGAPPLRRLLSSAANTLVKLRFGLFGITTYSSFFRLHQASLLRKAVAIHGEALITEPGFVCMVELLVKLKRMGARIDEVPMLLDARVRRGGSKMKVVRTIRTYLRILRGIAPPAPAPAGGHRREVATPAFPARIEAPVEEMATA